MRSIQNKEDCVIFVRKSFPKRCLKTRFSMKVMVVSMTLQKFFEDWQFIWLDNFLNWIKRNYDFFRLNVSFSLLFVFFVFCSVVMYRWTFGIRLWTSLRQPTGMKFGRAFRVRGTFFVFSLIWGIFVADLIWQPISALLKDFKNINWKN